VGTGQLHVVQRLPARQLDLAGVEKIHRSRPRPLAAGYSQKTRVHQRKKSLRHRHPAPVAIGSSQIVAVSWRAGGRKQCDSAPFFSRWLLKRAHMLRRTAMWMSSRKHASPLFSCDSFTSRPKRDLLLYVARHWAVALLCDALSLRHKARGTLSQIANHQELSVSPGSAQRRVVPWGDVSSWVKGAE